MTDESIMPFGRHKGEPMANVPDKYLKWLWHENKVAFNTQMGYQLMKPELREVMEYIEDCFDEKEL